MQANREAVYKTALLRAIAENDFREAEDAISYCLSKEDGKEKLACDRDINNHSYLSYAFECGAIEIARRLYPLVSDRTEVLLNDDIHHRSLFWHAIPYEDLAIDISEKLKALGPESENNFLSAPDRYEVSPLHRATLHGKNVILSILLNNIAKKPNAKALVNHKDLNGQTALVHAILRVNPEATRLLLEGGATWDSITFGLFASRPIDQLKIFTSLKENNQAELLKFWRSELLSKPNNPALKESYFKFAARHSLKALTAAHYELQADLHLQLPFTLKAPLTVNDGLGALRDSAPIFYENLKLKLEKAKEKTREVVFEEVGADEHSLFTQHVIVKDDAALLALVSDMERVLQSVEFRPTSYSIWLRMAVIGLTTAVTLVWLVPIIVLAVLAGLNPIDRFVIPAITVGPGAGVFGIAASIGVGCGTYYHWWDKQVENTISHREWEAVLRTLQEKVIDNLNRIDRSRKESSEPLLNISDQVKDSIKVEARKLKSNYRSSSDIAAILRQLSYLVDCVRQEMNRTKRPLSLLFSAPGVDLERGPDTDISAPRPK